MNELRARYGALEVELFNLKVAVSEVSLEMERRLKCAVEHPQGVELTRANGDLTLYIVGASSPEHLNLFLGQDHPLAVRFSEMCAEYVRRIQDEYEAEQVARLDREDAPAPEGCDCVFCVDTEVEDIPADSPVHCGEECDTCDEEAAERVARKTRSDKGTTREGVRAIDRSSCCGAEGRRMNTSTFDCAACRGVVE